MRPRSIQLKKKMMDVKSVFVLVLTAGMVWVGSAYSSSSWLVYNSPTGLVYDTYANEGQANAVNKIPDFSKAGYQGGGVAIPFVPAAAMVSPTPGDDTAAIQDAIDYVSALPVGPDGFRGAVLLEAGEYTVSSSLTISTSGVVIRGAGSQENGGTRITYTATVGSNVINISGGSGPSEIGGTRVSIADSFVPVGATSFNVLNASGFSPGDQIMVQNTVNQAWLDDMSNMSQWGWSVSGYQLTHRYVITAVNGNTITIDAPIVQTIESQYGGGDVYRYSAGLLENIGVEAIRFESTYQHIADEAHGRYAVRIDRLQNGWVRQITARYFVQGAVSIDTSSQFITVEDCAALDHKSMISGGRRYSFSIDDSQYLLVQRCLTREGRHDYVSGSRTPGPNAFVDCRADNTHADIGPHHRYATGQIYDNIMGGAINGGKNARGGGSGHGWTGAQILLWNCDATSIQCDAPNGAMNWCIGSVGTQLADGGGEPFGIWDSHNIPVTPRSLYYTQLTERLGTNALNNVVLPAQKSGTIWTELHDWGGDGLFLDELVVLADVETVPAIGESLAIRGIVRNLTMLDNGATFSWRKVYGPGSAVFADESALETTVSFSADGAYLLELSVDDGISLVKGAVVVSVGAGGGDAGPPAVPTGFSATDNIASVSLDWADNGETDLAGYDLFRSTVTGDVGVALAYGLTSSEYTDLSPEKGILYYYTVRAVDTNSNVSARSAEVSAMVNALPTVEFIQPLDGETLNYGGTLYVGVDAADKGGSVANVELFIDEQFVRQETAAPYEWGAAGQNDILLQNVAVGNHVLKAVATDDQGTSTTNSIGITVEVDVTPPAAPTGLFATADYGWVSLGWDDNADRDLAGYTIYRSTVPGSYGAALTNVTESGFYDLGLNGGTVYYYRVTATDTNGFESVASSEAQAAPRQAPAGMTLFGFNNDGLGGFTQSTAAPSEIWTTEIGSVRYRMEDTGTQNASLLKSYTLDRSDGQSYRIEGIIGLVDGYAEDNNRMGIYLFGDYPDLTAEAGGPEQDETGALCVLLNLEGGSFKVMQGIDKSTIATVTHGRAKDYTWFGEDIKISVDITFNGSNIDIDATLTDGQDNVTTVSTSVLAADYTGNYFGFATRSRTRDFGIPGAIKSAPFTMDYRSFWVTDPDDTAPSAPTGLAATAGNSQVTLDWSDNAESDMDTYTVYRSTTSGSYEEPLIDNLAASSYIDYLADNDTTYYYVVTASDYHGNESSQSSEVSATPYDASDTTPPAAPTGLVATAGDGSVSLNWDDNGEADLDSYSVYRSTTSGIYGGALATDLPSSGYTDDSAVNGTTYYYVVTAVDLSTNESVKSAEVSATPEQITAVSDGIIFGSNNDGFGGFVTNTPLNDPAEESWSLEADSVRYITTDDDGFPDIGTAGGTHIASLLKNFPLMDRSSGTAYTIEGIVDLTDGYGDDNNRIGIVLFNPNATQSADGGGGLYLRLNTDNSKDISIRDGINGTDLGSQATGVGAGDDWIGQTLTFKADLTFTNVLGTDFIDVAFTMIDRSGNEYACSAQVASSNYTGSYFGFATKARNRGASSSNRAVPWTMDYKSFSIVETTPSGLTGYELWAEAYGGTNVIGSGTDDFDSDGVNNIGEYVLDGNPTNALDRGTLPVFWKSGNEFIYVHPQRSDDTNIIYQVEATTNLISGAWTNMGYTVMGTNVTGGTLDFVTNNVDTIENEKFIRLKVEQ